MKKLNLMFLVLMCVININAQQKNGITGETNWFNGWASFKPKTVVYQEANQILSGDINKNTTLTKDKTYLLVGTVRIIDNAILTIEAGTVIRGDYDTTGTLTIVKGSKIIAEGTITDPIIFTSNKRASERNPGDWGGIIILGDAQINRFGGVSSSFYDANPAYNSFGGNNPNSDSGILKYVRIEFAGKKIDAKIALNGLTLAAVGNKTKIEYVQISFASDDAFEIVGGNIDFSNLISFRTFDDDFDFSMGAQSNVNNSVAIRNPYTSDNTRSRCFEIDSYDKIENFDATKNKTLIKINNCTLLNNEEGALGLIKEAISLKTDSFLEINNSLILGFSSFIALDDKYLDLDNYKKVKITNTLIDSCTGMMTNESLANIDLINNWFSVKNKFILTSNIGLSNIFKNIDVKNKPDFRTK